VAYLMYYISIPCGRGGVGKLTKVSVREDDLRARFEPRTLLNKTITRYTETFGPFKSVYENRFKV
jgi:hypothetical protein